MSSFDASSVLGENSPVGAPGGQFIDTASNWASRNPKLLAGQIGIESDTGRLKWGDGKKLWNQLIYRTDPPAESYQFERSGKDENGIYTVVTYRRANNTKFRTSTLSGGSSPEYSLRTVRYYGEDGVTVVSTIYFALNYSDGELISEVFD